MKKISIGNSEILRKTAIASIWICYPSSINHVLNNLGEIGAELKVSVLGPLKLLVHIHYLGPNHWKFKTLQHRDHSNAGWFTRFSPHLFNHLEGQFSCCFLARQNQNLIHNNISVYKTNEMKAAFLLQLCTVSFCSIEVFDMATANLRTVVHKTR